MQKADILTDREVLETALEGLELKRARLDEKIAELKALLGKRPRGRPRKGASTAAAPPPAKKKRKMSAAARKRMSEAQRRRRTSEKKATKKTTKKPTKKQG